MDTKVTYILISAILLAIGIVFYLLRIKLKLIQAQNIDLQNKLTTSLKEIEIAEVAKSSAEAANLAKNKYLSGISHELRTPLNVIMGYAQLLERQAKDEDSNLQSYQLIKKNCEHLSQLIEGILEFSAIESGRIKVQSDVIDFKVFLDEISQMFKTQADQKNLTFITDIDGKIPKYVKTDPKRLKQILFNLLSNAIKFTQNGQVQFEVNYKNQIATFKVIDSGCGIDEKYLEQIFQPFERLNAGSHSINGTGLGLTITKLMTEVMGGEISVTSEPNSGSEFIVKLMLSPQVEDLNQPVDNIMPNQQNHKVLIVDDILEHRTLIHDAIIPYGFDAQQANNAASAKLLMNDTQFDLAFFDVSMPDEDGWQLAMWCNKNHPNMKIIMVSANPRDLIASRTQIHHAYLMKPIQINNLLATINQVLSLGWEYKAENQSPSLKEKTVPLKRKDKLELKELIQIGHINGIENTLKEMFDQGRLNHENYQLLLTSTKQLNLNKLSQMTGIND